MRGAEKRVREVTSGFELLRLDGKVARVFLSQSCSVEMQNQLLFVTHVKTL